MLIEHEKNGSVDTVTLTGELVMSSCAEIRTRIQKIVTSGNGHLVLDLAAVPFMDSSGLSVLVSVLKEVRKKQGRMVLCHVAPEVRALLELTRLHQVFKIHDDQDTAISQLSAA